MTARDTQQDARFTGIPGRPELWRNSTTGVSYIVYFVPGTNPPIPLLFSVPTQRDLESFGPEAKMPDKTFTSDQLLSTGAIGFGSTDQIPDKDGSAWAGFIEIMERAVEVQPWLEDDDVFAIFAGAWIEGRPVEEWELQTTDWWRSHNQAERDWMALMAGDPATAAQLTIDNQLQTEALMNQIGLEAPNQVVEWMATQLTTGHWSAAYLSDQINALAGGTKLDAELEAYLSEGAHEIAPSELAENQIRSLWNEWLGPARQPRQQALQRWAREWRKAPEATRDELINHLRNRRLAMLPQFEDPNLTYQDIAADSRDQVYQAWGQLPDETDSFFLKLLRTEDVLEKEAMLRKEGVKRGNQQVMRDLGEALNQVTGGNVIGAMR